LLFEPLRSTKKDIYIIVDGLDEADNRPDECNPTGKSELHALLLSMATLPYTRLMFLSRPNADVSSILRNVTTKTIGREDNATDINAYIKNEIAASYALQQHFKNENIDPIQYFKEKANGIFLWVSLVIKQLSQVKTRSVFRRHLDRYSDASGSMEKLYRCALLDVHSDEMLWVREIIQWLVVAERGLSIWELKDEVEWSLQDQHVDFESFIRVECGAFLRVIWDNVQFIHETFRFFVLHPNECPQEFLVHEPEAHGHLALHCMKRLSYAGERDGYSIHHWVTHLSKATATTQAGELLVLLHRVFTSSGLRSWILCRTPYYYNHWEKPRGLRIYMEEDDLEKISKWLRNYETADPSSVNPTGDVNDESLKSALIWRAACLNEISPLGDQVGKAATVVWLHEAKTNQEAKFCFLLALKYYWRRPDRSQSNVVELDDLVSTEFKNMSLWSGSNDPQLPVTKWSIGIGLFCLQRWDDCIRYLDEDGAKNVIRGDWHLGMAFLAIGNYDRAIERLGSCLLEEGAFLYDIDFSRAIAVGLWRAYRA
jgi:hypothetical protein